MKKKLTCSLPSSSQCMQMWAFLCPAPTESKLEVTPVISPYCCFAFAASRCCRYLWEVWYWQLFTWSVGKCITQFLKDLFLFKFKNRNAAGTYAPKYTKELSQCLDCRAYGETWIGIISHSMKAIAKSHSTWSSSLWLQTRMEDMWNVLKKLEEV